MIQIVRRTGEGSCCGGGNVEEMVIAQELLDELWDFGDPVASEQRFRAYLRQPEQPEQIKPEQIELTETKPEQAGLELAEIGSQLARALGLQGRFEEAADVLAGLDDPSPVVRVRVLLESGRLKNSSGHPKESVPAFEKAAQLAEQHGLDFLRVDALHMLAIAQPTRARYWTEAGLAAIQAAAGTEQQLARLVRWRVSLLNNLGWALHDAGEQPEALTAFNQALEATREIGSAQQVFSARWAVARQLRELGRRQEALEIQQQLAAENPEAQYVQEELRELARSVDDPD